MSSYILSIACDDETGLVYKITEVLFRYRLNIIANDEYVDNESARFFMRTEFSGNESPKNLEEEVLAVLPKNANVKLSTQGKKKIIVLVTKENHCLGDLLIRHHADELQGEILAVIGNHNTLGSLCQKFDIPFHYVPHENKTREVHEQEIIKIIEGYQPEYLVLAKFMRILSPNFIQHFCNKIINIHHSFLPAFVGARPYEQAYLRGVKIIGATAHYVTENLDEGPIIAQNIVRVTHRYSAYDMAQAGRDIEKTVLAKALQLVFKERVFINDNKTVIFD